MVLRTEARLKLAQEKRNKFLKINIRQKRIRNGIAIEGWKL